MADNHAPWENPKKLWLISFLMTQTRFNFRVSKELLTYSKYINYIAMLGCFEGSIVTFLGSIGSCFGSHCIPSLASESSKVPLGTPEQGVEPALLKKPKPLAMLRVTCSENMGEVQLMMGVSGELHIN